MGITLPVCLACTLGMSPLWPLRTLQKLCECALSVQLHVVTGASYSRVHLGHPVCALRLRSRDVPAAARPVVLEQP